MSDSDRYPAGASQPHRVPVIDTMIGRKRLYADPRMIVFGKKSVQLDEAEWILYSRTDTTTHRMLVPASRDSQWRFGVGKYPLYGAPEVHVSFYKGGRPGEDPPEWMFLVRLAMQYLAPRLLADLVGRVRGGETVTVGGTLKVNQSGISCPRPKFALPWQSVAVSEPYGGAVWIYQAGVEKPLVNAPLDNPNSVLIPALVAALQSSR